MGLKSNQIDLSGEANFFVCTSFVIQRFTTANNKNTYRQDVRCYNFA